MHFTFSLNFRKRVPDPAQETVVWIESILAGVMSKIEAVDPLKSRV